MVPYLIPAQLIFKKPKLGSDLTIGYVARNLLLPLFSVIAPPWKKAQPIIGLTDEWGAGQPDFHRHRQNRHRGNFFQQNRHCWQDFQQSACSEWLAGILPHHPDKEDEEEKLFAGKSNDTPLE